MKRRLWWILLLGASLLLWLGMPAGRNPTRPAHAQVQYATPTPQPDGRIIYIVQPGDTCIRISLLTGLSVEQIIILNRLDETCSLQEGQQLLLGTGASINPTTTPFFAITPTPSEPTPTPKPGYAEICVLVFEDQNGDTLHQETEPPVLGAVVGVTSANGQVNRSGEMDLQPADVFQGVCFDELPEGRYTISAAVPPEYNATMPLSYEIDALAGDRIFIGFGAQQRDQSRPTDDQSGQRSPLLGLLGSGMLVLGAILLWYLRRNQPKSPYGLR